MNEGFITINKTARYFTLGELNEQTSTIWFVCHGYGDLAQKFLQNFTLLENEEHFIVAPEALSRFYLKGVNGKVGASWMTKEARESEIQDYVNYLDRLYHSLLYDHQESVKINILGFSQGAATVSRWISNNNCKVDNFILWAGLFPPDLDFKVDQEIFQKLNVWLMHGTDDTTVKSEKVVHQAEVLSENHIPHQTIEYEGGHEITDQGLEKLISKL